MSAENVEKIEQIIRGFEQVVGNDLALATRDDAVWQRLIEGPWQVCDPDIEVTMAFTGMAPVTYPAGLDGLRLAWQDHLSNLAAYMIEIGAIIDGGEQIVVTHTSRVRSGPEETELSLRRATVWTFRDGRAVKADFNLPYAEALARAGLSPAAERG